MTLQCNPGNLHDPPEVLELRPKHRPQQVMPPLNDLLSDESSAGRLGIAGHDQRGRAADGTVRGPGAGH